MKNWLIIKRLNNMSNVILRGFLKNERKRVTIEDGRITGVEDDK